MTGTPARLAAAATAALAATLFLTPPSTAAHTSHSTPTGCASLAGVTSFHGHAAISFHSTASGGFPGTTKSRTIRLARSAYGLDVTLTRKFARGPYVFFTGKTTGGAVKVDDSDTTTNSEKTETLKYDGAVSTTLPQVGTQLIFDLASCKYVFADHYGVKAKFSGDATSEPYTIVGASVNGEREKIPSSLHLVGGAGPDADGKACDDPIMTGQACYTFTGGWSEEFAQLYRCHSVVPTGDCATNGTPVGTAHFIWTLFPNSK